MLYFIQDTKVNSTDAIFQLYKSSYKTIINKAWSIDDYIGLDKNIKFRELQYYTYPIWLGLFVEHQNQVFGLTKDQIIANFDLESLRKCFSCFSIDIDTTIQKINFNDVLDLISLTGEGEGIINVSVLNEDFIINGFPPVTVIEEEIIDLLAEINKGLYQETI